MIGESLHGDLTWRDAWDAESAIALLTKLSTKAANQGDYETAGHLSNIISYIEQMTEVEKSYVFLVSDVVEFDGTENDPESSHEVQHGTP